MIRFIKRVAFGSEITMDYGVIFDCDGVLVDSEKISCVATALTLNQFGVKTDLAEVEQFIGRSNHEYLRYYEQRDGIALDIDRINRAIRENYFQAALDLQPMPGIERLLQELQAVGVPVAVASSGEQDKIRFSLEKTGLLKYLPVRCSAEEVVRGKPEPDLFLWAARNLQLAPEYCYVVEDSLYGVTAGKRAGMSIIGYTASFPETELHRAGADWVIDDFGSLMVTADGLRVKR
jgi:HAD superfamily hydrolase (TIGR01509 family)